MMPARDHISGEQLKMFMSAREITSRFKPLEADREATVWDEDTGDERLENDDELWERKADEAWDYGLANDIMKHGVQRPVHLGRGEVVGGHHRIAVMGQESPDELIPVLHHRSLGDARQAPLQRYYRYT